MEWNESGGGGGGSVFLNGDGVHQIGWEKLFPHVDEEVGGGSGRRKPEVGGGKWVDAIYLNRQRHQSSKERQYSTLTAKSIIKSGKYDLNLIDLSNSHGVKDKSSILNQ